MMTYEEQEQLIQRLTNLLEKVTARLAVVVTERDEAQKVAVTCRGQANMNPKDFPFLWEAGVGARRGPPMPMTQDDVIKFLKGRGMFKTTARDLTDAVDDRSGKTQMSILNLIDSGKIEWATDGCLKLKKGV